MVSQQERNTKQQMTWEITLGIFAILSAFIAVFNIVVRVNRTLCSLEVVVKQIKECMERQSEKNGLFFNRLSDHDIRLTRIEDRLDMKPRTKEGNKYE
jgi:hypothetical protein